MFLAEPPATAYDVRFQLLGIPVRVTPFFWVAAAVLGWDLAAMLDASMAAAAGDPLLEPIAASNPGQGVLLVLWVAAVFLTILAHELGHALVMRRYGIGSKIVLYHFGGLAVPNTAGAFMRFGGYTHPFQQIVISVAGPITQLLLAATIIAGLRLSGSAILLKVPLVHGLIPLSEGRQLPSLPIQAAVYFLLVPSILWALMNLLPVFPLDGGQIARALFSIFSPRDGLRQSLVLSFAVATGVAVYSFTTQDVFLAMFFGTLAYSSYQVLQACSGRGGGFGGGPW